MQAQIVKAVLSQALLFGIKDILEKCKLNWSHQRPSRITLHSVLNCSLLADVVLALILYARTSGRAVGVKV